MLDKSMERAACTLHLGGTYTKHSLSIGTVVGVLNSPSSLMFHVNILKISINDLFQYAFLPSRLPFAMGVCTIYAFGVEGRA